MLLPETDAAADPHALCAVRGGEAVPLEPVREALLRERLALAAGLRPGRVRGVTTP